MNWYKKAQFKKQASLSFWIEGSDKISQPMTKLDICNDLSKFISYDMGIGEKLGINFNDVDPDDSSGNYYDSTGPISIYLKNLNIKEGIINNIIEQYNNHKLGQVKLRFLEINKSGLRKDVNVARILIEENDTTNIEKLPELNVSNSNSVALISLLQNEGMGNLDPYGGVLNISELKNAITNIEQNNYILDSYTQEPMEQREEGKATIYDGGRSYQQLQRYIEALKQMVNYVETNLPNPQDQNINYG